MKISTLIVYYITIFFISFVMLKIFGKYTEKTLKINVKVFIKVSVISLLCCVNNIFNVLEFRTIISTALTFIMFKIIYNDTTDKTLFYTIIISILLYFIELIISLFLPLWIRNIDVLNSKMWFKVGFTILVNAIQYLLLTNRFVVSILKKLKEIIKKSKIYYIFIIALFIIFILWIYKISLNINDKILNLSMGVVEVIIIGLFIKIIHNNYEKKIYEIKENQLKQNLDLYSKIATEHKELKHNLMNDFLIIKSKLAKKDQEFINDIINKYKSNYDWINDVTDIPEGLQGLVFLKKNQAEIKKVKINLEYNIDKNIEESYKINNNFKLYETLGILFDNAIEGAYESKEKIVNVVFSYNKNNLQISILNTFNNEIDLDKIGDKNYSTKNRGSGIGLNYIKRNNNKFKINQNIQGNIFITDIIINHKEKK